MPGITKRKYVGETMRYNKSIKRLLYLVAEILPKIYDSKMLLEYFKKYYPVEWNNLVQMQKSYYEKDKFLLSIGKKVRYKPLSPDKYFFSIPVVKNILCDSTKNSYRSLFNEEEHEAKLIAFEHNRKLIIDKHNTKIMENDELLQEIDPHYVDFYIATYHKKGISVEEKVEIVKDLSKYNSKIIDTFFYKLNDSERNNQVRKIAFDYLQRTGKYVKLRENFKGKKKIYMLETTSFNMTPEDLYKRLYSNGIQTKKSFDVFISHSFIDQKKIIRIFKSLNEQGLVCYCDWTNDNDFLKRKMAGEYTKEVLKKRIEQSEYILYASSDNSAKSNWVNFELEYGANIEKTIKVLDINNISNEEISSKVLKLINQYKEATNE